jgi:hypothetical protein
LPNHFDAAANESGSPAGALLLGFGSGFLSPPPRKVLRGRLSAERVPFGALGHLYAQTSDARTSPPPDLEPKAALAI